MAGGDRITDGQQAIPGISRHDRMAGRQITAVWEKISAGWKVVVMLFSVVSPLDVLAGMAQAIRGYFAGVWASFADGINRIINAWSGVTGSLSNTAAFTVIQGAIYWLANVFTSAWNAISMAGIISRHY
jgi:uncharacterized membrane protein YqgA involved in biofilm formation